MEAKEFRILNYVNHISFGDVQISGILKESLKIDYENNEYWDDFKFYKPIPLTEEWLLRFGFVVRYFNEDKKKPLFCKVEKNRHIDIYFEPAISSYAFKINSIQYSTAINYVHQLQNLFFALTGEELTLKKE